jgi:hypothetical protein
MLTVETTEHELHNHSYLTDGSRIRGSRAASTQVPKDEARVKEIINGL